MKVTKSLAELQKEHVVMQLECIDRMYLNAYVPQLTSEAGIAAFCRGYLGHRFASTKQAVAMTETFVKSIRAFIESEGVELVHFKKGQRKDDVLQAKLRRFHKQEGVIFVGVAQEKVRVPRTTRKRLESGGTVPWIIYSTAMVNVYYFYCRDRDFGPFFLKFCSYFPYSAKLCLNGHEYLKCQLTQRGIGFEAMDNGLLSCTDIQAAQQISDGLSAGKIQTFFRKWLARLPHPYSAKDRKAGYRYDLSILQAEFSLTHDCHVGAEAFEKLQQPAEVDGQHVSALPFGQERVQALLTVLVLFCLQPEGFRNRQLRPLLAQLLGIPESKISPGRMSYDLRRLRLHGLIERIPKSQRYRLTTFGLKTALFYTRTYYRLLRRGLSELHDPRTAESSPLALDFARFKKALDVYCAEKMAA